MGTGGRIHRQKPAAPLAGREQARTDTKKAIVLELLQRKQGAAMSEIGKATGWQNHTIRGFISGNVTKTMGLAVESFKSEAGARIYRIGSLNHPDTMSRRRTTAKT